MSMMTYDEIKLRMDQLYDIIVQGEDQLLKILQKTETYKTAKSEIQKSLHCLQHIDKQAEYLAKDSLTTLCVFLPLNQPLYSLILFVVIPGCRFYETYFRPPVLLQTIYEELYGFLELQKFGIFCNSITRRQFLFKRVSCANAIIYTGKYENSLEVMAKIPHNAVFIYQGSATNPIVITESATITDELIEKVVGAQIYNSGQDCMAPAAILVSANHWQNFLNRLETQLRRLKIGSYNCADADVSFAIEPITVENAEYLIHHTKAKLLYGGSIDKETMLVYPTILRFAHVSDLPYASSFSPVFSLYCYSNEQEVTEYLSRLECRENRAYVSVFGKLSKNLDDEIIIMDDTLDSVDDGYSEFGGYGIRSGYIAHENSIVAHPILISKELAMF